MWFAPRGLHTIRGYGLYGDNRYSRLAQAFSALGQAVPDLCNLRVRTSKLFEQKGIDPSVNRCPVCCRELEVVERFPRPYWRSARSSPESVEKLTSYLSSLA